MAQQINLYDPALRRQRDWLALGNVVGLAAVLAVVVGALGYVARLDLGALAASSAANESQLKAARDQITALGQKVASRKPDPRIEQELASQRLLLEARGEVLAILRQSVGDAAGPRFADYMRGFARQSVSGLWLTAFRFDAQSGGMEIRGRTLDPALLPEYIRRLNREAAFQGRAFASLKIDAGQAEAAAPSTPAAPAAPAPRARHHEFVLIPVVAEGAGEAKLTQNGGGDGRPG
jgi:hypothetical protein